MGNGTVGPYLKGNTDISAYNKTITVGDTVVDAATGRDIVPAIGIYSEKQGVSGTPYVIKSWYSNRCKSSWYFQCRR